MKKTIKKISFFILLFSILGINNYSFAKLSAEKGEKIKKLQKKLTNKGGIRLVQPKEQVTKKKIDELIKKETQNKIDELIKETKKINSENKELAKQAEEIKNEIVKNKELEKPDEELEKENYKQLTEMGKELGENKEKIDKMEEIDEETGMPKWMLELDEFQELKKYSEDKKGIMENWILELNEFKTLRSHLDEAKKQEENTEKKLNEAKSKLSFWERLMSYISYFWETQINQ